MPNPREPEPRVPIAHDAPLSEVWVTEKGVRFRAYRGDTQEHIDWKMAHHREQGHRPELVVVPLPAAEDTEFDDGDPRDTGLAGV